MRRAVRTLAAMTVTGQRGNTDQAGGGPPPGQGTDQRQNEAGPGIKLVNDVEPSFRTKVEDDI